MAEIKTLRGGKVATSELDGQAFGERLNPVVLREAVLMYESNRRVGTASTKTRSEVSGSTKKMYKQKHTGRARHGDKKATSSVAAASPTGPSPATGRTPCRGRP